MGLEQLNQMMIAENRELGTKKSALQMEINKLNKEESRLKLSMSKLETRLLNATNELAALTEKGIKAESQVLALNASKARLESDIKDKTTELSEVETTIKIKLIQAKKEIDEAIEARMQEARVKAQKITADANMLHSEVIAETQEIREDTQAQVEMMINDAEDKSREIKGKANDYYEDKLVQADNEYQKVVQKASAQYGVHIQNAVEELAELNNDIKQAENSVQEYKSKETIAIHSLGEVEALLSERQVILDRLQLDIIEYEGERDASPDISYKEELGSKLNEIANLEHEIKVLEGKILEITGKPDDSEALRDKIAEMNSKHLEEVKSLTEIYESEISDIKNNLEATNKVKGLEKALNALELELEEANQAIATNDLTPVVKRLEAENKELVQRSQDWKEINEPRKEDTDRIAELEALLEMTPIEVENIPLSLKGLARIRQHLTTMLVSIIIGIMGLFVAVKFDLQGAIKYIPYTIIGLGFISAVVTVRSMTATIKSLETDEEGSHS